MAKILVEQEGAVGAPADITYKLIADYSHHKHFLPEGFSDFKVLEGGVGAQTVLSFTLTAGRRVRQYVMRVDEPAPGSVLTETDQGSSLVTTFTVTPDGDTCRVKISTSWDGASGVGGFFEKTFAPKVMQKMYADELELLDVYATRYVDAVRWTG